MQHFFSKNKAYLLPLLAGALLPLAFAPFNIWPLVILSPLIFLFAINTIGADNKQTLIRAGFSFWFAYYLVGVSWVYVSIHEYGYTPAPIAALLAFIFAAGLALVTNLQIVAYTKLNLHRFYLISFPASWVLIEWFRAWFLTGFPWLYSGYAFIDSPLAPYASIGGVYLLSFIAVLLSCLLYYLLEELLKKNKSLIHITFTSGAILLMLLPALFLKNFSWVSEQPSTVLRFHLVQGNIPQHDKWLPENQRQILIIFNDLIQETFLNIQTEQLEDQKNGINRQHVIVLPEAAMPTLQSELAWFFDELDQQANMLNIAVISGIFYDENGEGFLAKNIYNSVISIGAGSGLYHKQKLVPFGEYVPLENFIRGLIPFFDLPYSSFARGQWGQPGLQVFDTQIAPFVCYEILYPALVFDHAKQSDLLLTISNDAWFGNSTGPEQHFQMARMRALELGKYLIRTTNTGRTAIINPQGKVLSELPKNTRAVLTGDASVTSGKTPFAIVGNSPILLFCGFLFVLSLILSYANRRNNRYSQTDSHLIHSKHSK